MSETVLETDGLTRRFGKLVAVDNVSVSISDDQITSIIGPNGAGKTTFYNMLSGRLDVSEGTIKLRDEDTGELADVTGLSPFEINRAGLSRAFQINNVFDGLTVSENLRVARISKNNRSNDLRAVARDDPELTNEVNEIIDLVGLEEIENTVCENLSHGDKRKVEIALALGTDPSIALFDEPTAGMNATETEKMVELIATLDEETDTTFMITEHDMDVVLNLADRILVLDNGQVIADDTPEEVIQDEIVREAYLGGEL